MQLILNIDPTSASTLQAQLILQFRTLIRSGQLKLSSLLPSTRELSSQLNVSRNTISQVYEKLIDEGYLVAKLKVGTFVTDKLPEDCVYISHQEVEAISLPTKKYVNLPLPYNGRGQSGLHRAIDTRILYDFSLGQTDTHLFPKKIWGRLVTERLAGAATNMSHYHDPAGLSDLRLLIANFLGPTRGLVVSKEQVLIVGGCQQGLSLVAHMFVSKHTSVVVEAPCYRGAAYLFESYGGKLIKVPVDEFGLDVTKLPDHPVKLVYVTPSHQFPTGVTMSLERRLALLDWAAENKAYIVEVDYDVNFRYEDSPLPSLWSLDKNNSVIYMSSFSRSLGPGLRLGYVVVPDDLVGPATRIRSLLDNGSSWLEQATLEQFIMSGSFEQHLLKLRHKYHQRRDALVSAIKNNFVDAKISGMEAGMHLLLKLSESEPNAQKIQQIGRTCGVGVYPLIDSPSCFYEDMIDNDKFILLGYNHLDESIIKKGISTLAEAIKAES